MGNIHKQCNIPALTGNQTYVQVAAGAWHTVLIRSDGSAVACGENDDGRCDVPALFGGQKYVHAAAGSCHTVLIQSNGSAVVRGKNGKCQNAIPPLWKSSLKSKSKHQSAIPSSWKSSLRSATSFTPMATACTLLRAIFNHAPGTMSGIIYEMHLTKLSGEKQCSLKVVKEDQAADIFSQLLHLLGPVDVVLPDGQLLSRLASQDPSSTFERFMTLS